MVGVSINPPVEQKIPNGFLIPFCCCIFIDLRAPMAERRNFLRVEHARNPKGTIPLQILIEDAANDIGSLLIHNVALILVEIAPRWAPRQNLQTVILRSHLPLLTSLFDTIRFVPAFLMGSLCFTNDGVKNV